MSVCDEQNEHGVNSGPYITGFMVCVVEGFALYATFVEPMARTSMRHTIRVVAVASLALVIAGLLLWRRGAAARCSCSRSQ
jgi:hypothetical protein